MTPLAKLAFKTVHRSSTRDPKLARRGKLIAGIKQQLMHAARIKGEDYRIQRNKWMNNAQGERVSVKAMRVVRPSFFAEDSGWYVKCRYGARVMAVDGSNNAVFVKSLQDVAAVINALIGVANAGELDSVIAQTTPRIKSSSTDG